MSFYVPNMNPAGYQWTGPSIPRESSFDRLYGMGRQGYNFGYGTAPSFGNVTLDPSALEQSQPRDAIRVPLFVLNEKGKSNINCGNIIFGTKAAGPRSSSAALPDSGADVISIITGHRDSTPKIYYNMVQVNEKLYMTQKKMLEAYPHFDVTTGFYYPEAQMTLGRALAIGYPAGHAVIDNANGHDVDIDVSAATYENPGRSFMGSPLQEHKDVTLGVGGRYTVIDNIWGDIAAGSRVGLVLRNVFVPDDLKYNTVLANPIYTTNADDWRYSGLKTTPELFPDGDIERGIFKNTHAPVDSLERRKFRGFADFIPGTRGFWCLQWMPYVFRNTETRAAGITQRMKVMRRPDFSRKLIAHKDMEDFYGENIITDEEVSLGTMKIAGVALQSGGAPPDPLVWKLAPIEYNLPSVSKLVVDLQWHAKSFHHYETTEITRHEEVVERWAYNTVLDVEGTNLSRNL